MNVEITVEEKHKRRYSRRVNHHIQARRGTHDWIHSNRDQHGSIDERTSQAEYLTYEARHERHEDHDWQVLGVHPDFALMQNSKLFL